MEKGKLNVCWTSRHVTTIGHQGGRRVKGAGQFFKSMSNSFKIRPTNFSCGDENFSRGGFVTPGYGPVDFYTSQKTNVLLRTLCAFSVLVQFSKIRSRKPGCAPASPAAHLQCSTARIWRDLSAAWFCSCKLLWRRDECVTLPCFNGQPDIFAVINCCVVALMLFFHQ